MFHKHVVNAGTPEKVVGRGAMEEGNEKLKGFLNVLRQNGGWIPCGEEYGVDNTHD